MKQSGEDYLETIYVLSARNGEVHAVDIARELNYSKPSITKAMNILKNDGFITVDGSNHIKLTEQGLSKAEEVYERHQILTKFWTILGVSNENASNDACRIEHDISEESFCRLKDFVERHDR